MINIREKILNNFFFTAKNVWKILTFGWGQFFYVSLLIGFLLVLLNIILGLGVYMQGFSKDLRDKLGVYFYIKETTGSQVSQIISLKSELEQQGLSAKYLSKADVLQRFTAQTPDLSTIFDTYDIGNPLPATLYITFDTPEKYEALKKTILKYKTLILNIKDITKAKNYLEQQQKVNTILSLSHFVLGFSYFLIGLLGVIIWTFLLLLLKTKFQAFHKQLEIEKLLGGSYRQIKKPFFLIVILVISISFLLSFAMISLIIAYIKPMLEDIFSINFWQIIGNYSNILRKTGGIEYGCILFVSILLADLFLNRMLKKV